MISILNHYNITILYSYDDRMQSINTTYQLGLFPKVIYKLQF